MRKAALIFLLALIIAGPAHAEKTQRQEILKKEKRLEDVKKQIREEKRGIKEISAKETNILGEIEEINKNLTQKRDELRQINDNLSGMQRGVDAAERDIKRLEAEKKSLAGRLVARLRAMYKMKRGEAMQVLFTSESANIARRHKYLTALMDLDAGLMDSYEKNLKTLESQKEKKARLMTDLEAARSASIAKKNEAEGLHRSKLALLGQVKDEKTRREHIVKELEQAASDLSNLIDRLRTVKEEPQVPEGTGFGAMKGRLSMPVAGEVVSVYGKVKHPKFQTVTFNNGIVIEAPLGTPVKSVYDGKVIYIGWLKGYGQVMILDHQGGYYTLFAHLGKVLKEKGDTAPKGAEIALVGDSGPENKAGLYFEIRQKGVPRDPAAWFAAR